MIGILSEKLKKISLQAYLGMGLIAIFSFLAVFKLAKDGLNADIIMNQIMAFDNVTLFYWGQNRLLNLIPILLAPVRLPLPNLFLVLFITSISFFCLIYALSFFSNKICGNDAKLLNTNFIFLINIAALVIFFKFFAWVEMTIWHIEYSLAALFMLLNIYAMYYGSKRYKLFTFILAFIATGLNPVIFMIISIIIFFICLDNLKITLRELSLLFIYFIFFIVWYYISKSYGSFDDYSSILPGMYLESMQRMLKNIIELYIRPGIITIALFLCACFYLFHDRFLKTKYNLDSRAKYIIIYSFIAAILISSFICCIRWFHLNEYMPRYMIFTIYIAVFANSIFFANIIAKYFNRKLIVFLSLPIICGILYFLYPPTFNLSKSTIYMECNGITMPGNNIYAGDYWLVWPAASRDLNRGFHSHTIAYRSISNKENIKAAMKQRLQENGKLEIFCLGKDQAVCKSQMNDYFDNYTVADIQKINDRNTRFTLTNLF